MASHTPEPWRLEIKPLESSGGRNTFYLILPSHACLYDDWRTTDEWGMKDGELLANAERIVACVNALEGIPTERLEAYAGHSNEIITKHRLREIQDMEAQAEEWQAERDEEDRCCGEPSYYCYGEAKDGTRGYKCRNCGNTEVS